MAFRKIILPVDGSAAAKRAATRRLPGVASPKSLAGASNTGTMEANVGRRSSHWGLSVATTNTTATNTVTVCENKSQSRFMPSSSKIGIFTKGLIVSHPLLSK